MKLPALVTYHAVHLLRQVPRTALAALWPVILAGLWVWLDVALSWVWVGFESVACFPLPASFTIAHCYVWHLFRILYKVTILFLIVNTYRSLHSLTHRS